MPPLRISLRSGLRGNLILAGAKPRGRCSPHLVQLRRAARDLAAAQPRGEAPEPQGRDRRRRRDARQAPPDGRRELVVVSDFQRSNWATADFSPLPEGHRHPARVGRAQQDAGQPRDPARRRPQGRVEQGREAQLEVEVGNYSATPRDVQVELTRRRRAYRLSGHCPPACDDARRPTCRCPTPGGRRARRGWIGARMRWRPMTRGRSCWTFGRRSTYPAGHPRAGQPHAVVQPFPRTALVPLSRAKDTPGERVVRIDPDRSIATRSAAADVIVLDHPGRLVSESMKLLASVAAPRPAVLYVAAEPIDATNLTLLADAAGSDLKMPVEFVPPAARCAAAGSVHRSNAARPALFHAFGEKLTAAIAPLRFGGGLDSRRTGRAGWPTTCSRLTATARPAWSSTSCGAGTLAVLNADLGQSNLAGSPVFVPLMGELVGRLVVAQRGGRRRAVRRAWRLLPAARGGPADRADDRRPGGRRQIRWATRPMKTGWSSWRWDDAGPPGVYQVKRGGRRSSPSRPASRRQESDLQPIDPACLTGRLAGGRTDSFPARGDDEDAPRLPGRGSSRPAPGACCWKFVGAASRSGPERMTFRTPHSRIPVARAGRRRRRCCWSWYALRRPVVDVAVALGRRRRADVGGLCRWCW